MRRIALLIVALAFAAPEAAAQGTPNRRPPRDTIRFAEPAPSDSADDEADDDHADADAAAADSVPRPGPFSRDGGRGPFSVEASGQVAPRPPRGEIVWLETAPAPRVASSDTAASRRASIRDTARTGSGRTASRDTASTRLAGARPNGTTRTSTGQTTRRATHTVAAGETFFGIARRYGVTAAQLRAMNPDVDWESVEVGEVLRLPATARDTRASGAGQGAARQPQTPAASRTPNRTGSRPTRPATRTHTVAPGETLFGIARRYGVTRQAVIDANELESDQLRTGQRLTIPPPD